MSCRCMLALWVAMVTVELCFAYYPMLLEAKGSCVMPLFKVSLLTTDAVCMKMTGAKATDSFCPLHLCKVPLTGAITKAEDVWGITDVESAKKIDDKDKVMVTWRMPRFECEELTGKPFLATNAKGNCEVPMIRQTNSNRTKLTDVYPFAGTDECPLKFASITMAGQWDATECVILNGTAVSFGCELDLCYTDVKQCVASDKWTNVQMCVNDASTPITCSISFEEGVSNTHTTGSTTGKAVGASVTAEVSSDFMGFFSASLSTSVSGDFNWEDTIGDESTWSSTSSHSMEVTVDPGKTMQIQQLVGTCGSIRVKTRNLRAVSHDHKSRRVSRVETRAYFRKRNLDENNNVL